MIVAGELIVQRANSKLVGLNVAIFDRVMDELIFHMHNLKVDETEFAYLKAMAIFDAGRFDLRSRRLKEGEKVDEAKMHFWRMLELYTRAKKPEEEARFASLVLKLHSLRSISSAMRAVDDGVTLYKHLFCDNLPDLESENRKKQEVRTDLSAESKTAKNSSLPKSSSSSSRSSSGSEKKSRVRIKSEPKGHLD